MLTLANLVPESDSTHLQSVHFLVSAAKLKLINNKAKRADNPLFIFFSLFIPLVIY